MERITYRITLDAHKTGIQKTLQGFDANDKLSRRIIISLTSGGKPVEFESTDTVAVMYVTQYNEGGGSLVSINDCTIENNTIIYDVLPLDVAGITDMQVKLIETSIDGAESVLMCPKFAVEVTDNVNDGEITFPTATFTALENALAQANGVYNERLVRIDIDEECTFRAYYADDTVYESDSFKEALGNYAGEARDSAYNAHVSEVGAKASASLAKISESNAKESEENAKVSEANAKRYMENALNATPEGYGLMDIQETTNTTLENSKAGGLKLVSMRGKTVQESNPSMDCPQPINRVVNVTIKSHGKNFLKCNGVDQKEMNGITFTKVYNPDGTMAYVSARGTATADAYMVVAENITLDAGTYNLNGCPVGGSNTTYKVYMSGGTYSTDYGHGSTVFTLNKKTLIYNVAVFVASGQTVHGIKFTPMIRIASESEIYQPYKETIATISCQDSLGDDDCICTIDGKTYEHHKQGELVIDGNSNVTLHHINNEYGIAHFELIDYSIKNDPTNCYCTHFTKSLDGSNTKQEGFFISEKSVYFRVRTDRFSTAEEFKSWLASNPMKLVYNLKTEKLHELDDSTHRAINELETFNEVTYIHMDGEITPSEIVTQYGTSKVGALTLANENLHRIISGEPYVRYKTIAEPVSVEPHITKTVTENNVDAIGTINAICTNDNITLSTVTIKNGTLNYSCFNSSETNQSGVVLITLLY